MFCPKNRHALQHKEHHTIWQLRRVLLMGMVSWLTSRHRMIMVMIMMPGLVVSVGQRLRRSLRFCEMMDTMRA